MYFSLFADTSSFVMLLIYRLVFLFGVRMLLQYMFLSLFVVKLFIAICNILGIIATQLGLRVITSSVSVNISARYHLCCDCLSLLLPSL
jgi:hypothetical protein